MPVPGKGDMRDECLNHEQFWTWTEARVLIEDYRLKYNHFRPHSKLGYLSPVLFAEQLIPSPSAVGLHPPSDGDGQTQNPSCGDQSLAGCSAKYLATFLRMWRAERMVASRLVPPTWGVMYNLGFSRL